MYETIVLQDSFFLVYVVFATVGCTDTNSLYKGNPKTVRRVFRGLYLRMVILLVILPIKIVLDLLFTLRQKLIFAEGGGLIVDDFNGDGHDDIFFQLWFKMSCILAMEQAVFTSRMIGFQHKPLRLSEGAAADYDGDGDVDIYVTVLGERDQLLRNDGDGFTNVIVDSGIELASQDNTVAVWYDIDLDGDLDLFVGAHRDDPYLDLDDDGEN